MEDAVVQTIKPASLQLLLVAEALFAERGVDAVSTREIAKAAGQKNHSAVAYHFGSKEALVQEILDLRLLPINKRRHDMLAYLEQAGQTTNVRALVGALVIPFADELNADPGQSHYIGFVSRLYASSAGQLMLQENPKRADSMLKVSRYLREAVVDVPAVIRDARLEMLGAQITQVIADWDRRRRQPGAGFDDAALHWAAENLVDVLAAGLQAKVSAPVRKGLVKSGEA